MCALGNFQHELMQKFTAAYNTRLFMSVPYFMFDMPLNYLMILLNLIKKKQPFMQEAN